MYPDRPLFADGIDRVNASRRYALAKKKYIDCFNTHIKQRIFSAIDVNFASQGTIEKIHNMRLNVNELMALRGDHVWFGAKGLFDLLVSKSGIDKVWLSNKFPNETVALCERDINPFGLFLGMIFDLGFDLIRRGHILACCDDDGLFSLIPPEMFINADFKSVFGKHGKEIKYSNIRFITVSDMAEFAFRHQNISKTGYISDDKSKMEQVALQLINDFLRSSAPQRISKCDAKLVITKIFNVTGKGFENRIWGQREKCWKCNPGAIPKELRLNSSDLEEYYQQNMANYPCNN